ncbi:A24 family peptidase [Vulgatibacter incomptus]|uniref:Type IV prepilin peptidase TadV/CpaA n=1 Tax=Vulgatibacter incomptus TaxID=1391653 RepID=A0A0K1PDF1_9BACT|nr:A24 family peptidase [Vulgatibacter incomptus]AKU91527.1 Type IV prepilin peptidase TadV/CpaA [Vulgatibacter incomptus]
MAPGAAPSILYALLAFCLSVSLATDLRSRKILDVVTLPTIGLALAARLLLAGWDSPLGLASGLVGAAVGLAAFLLPAWTGGMGMGDVKLAGAVGAILGWERILGALLLTAIAGGLLAFAVVIQAGTLGETIRNVWFLLLRALRIRRGGAELGERTAWLPYGVAIVAGTVASLFVGGGW